MVIYDSLLAGKRILFCGDTKQNSVEELQEYIYACVQMVCPPLMGVLNQMHPYVALQAHDLLEDACYIGGTLNPMFGTSKQFSKLYDLIIPINTGAKDASKPALSSVKITKNVDVEKG